ncbi:MAG: hypothetical protein NVS2B6_19120 [Thermoleophilaceae bacterium]
MSHSRNRTLPYEGFAPVLPEELARAEMLASLPTPVLIELTGHARTRIFEENEVVFSEGDRGDFLHIVRRGALKVIRPSDNPEVVLQLLEPGQAFGELAVLNAQARSASVIALEECETIEVAKADLDRVLDRNPDAVRNMLGSLGLSLTLAKEKVARHNQILETRVLERTHELHETQLEVIRRLGQAVEARDGETALHLTRIGRSSHRLALAVGLGADEAEMLRHASQMHDIGKIGIPDRILLKPGKLDPVEWETMKTHTTIGARILAGSRSRVVRMATQIAGSHHERWDGTGYPAGTAGEETPLIARICSICDVFDALISDRPYKSAWPAVAALAEIARGSGSQFDPILVKLFLELAPDLCTELDELDDVSPIFHAEGLPVRAAHI